VVPLDSNQRTSHDVFTGAVTATYAPSAEWRHEMKFTVLRDRFVYADLTDSISADSTVLANATGIPDRQWRPLRAAGPDPPDVELQHRATVRGRRRSLSSVTLGAAAEREIASDTVGKLHVRPVHALAPEPW